MPVHPLLCVTVNVLCLVSSFGMLLWVIFVKVARLRRNLGYGYPFLQFCPSLFLLLTWGWKGSGRFVGTITRVGHPALASVSKLWVPWGELVLWHWDALVRRVLGQSEVHIDVIQPSVRWRTRAQSVGAQLLLWQGEAAKRFVDIQWWLNYTSTAVLSGMASLRSDEE